VEIRSVEMGQQDRLAELHPELVADRPDLLTPALLNNPEPVESDFPYLFYALDGAKVVGHFMSFPDTLYADGAPRKWAWNLGLFTDPEYRGRGIARKIVELQLAEFGRRDMIWGGVFSSHAAIRLYERMGFGFPGFAQRLCLMRNARPFLRAHVSNALAVAAGGLAANTLLAAHRLLKRGVRSFGGYRVQPIDREEFSALVNASAVHPEAFYWGTDARWFTARSAENDVFCKVMRAGETNPCAFMIVRDRLVKDRSLSGRYSNFKMLSVEEFGQFEEAPDIAQALISGLLALFRDSDADIAEFVTSSPAIQASARRAGFVPFGAGMSFKFMAPPGHPLSDRALASANWHMTHYCGDGFGFE